MSSSSFDRERIFVSAGSLTARPFRPSPQFRRIRRGIRGTHPARSALWVRQQIL